jgi:hypothetical protein
MAYYMRKAKAKDFIMHSAKLQEYLSRVHKFTFERLRLSQVIELHPLCTHATRQFVSLKFGRTADCVPMKTGPGFASL